MRYNVHYAENDKGCLLQRQESLMKKCIILCLAVFLNFAACVPNKHHVKTGTHPSKKLIALSEKRKGQLEPYEINGERYYPLPSSDGFVQSGKASWYGKKFHGRRTANGEIYDMYKKSAAHKTLPFDTYVQVLNLSNNKQTIVKINDRGPFVKGRIIDLSYAAAKEIGLVGPGVAKIKIVALGKQVEQLNTPLGIKPVVEINDLNRGQFTVQVGAFSERHNALKLADRLKVIFNYVDVSVYNDLSNRTLYRVRVSNSQTLVKAGKTEKKLEEMGFEKAFIVSF